VKEIIFFTKFREKSQKLIFFFPLGSFSTRFQSVGGDEIAMTQLSFARMQASQEWILHVILAMMVVPGRATANAVSFTFFKIIAFILLNHFIVNPPLAEIKCEPFRQLFNPFPVCWW
jgi:hypothetical protein